MKLYFSPCHSRKGINLFARVFLYILFSSVFLSGCSSFSGTGTDNAPAPAALVAFTPELQLHSAWTTSVGGGMSIDYLKLGPVVNDKIFVADPHGSVSAFDIKSGRHIWRTKTHVAITSGPAIGNGLVVIGADSGQVIALDQATGNIMWSVTVPDALLAAPTIVGDRILVRTVDGKLSALDARDGHTLWLYDHSAPILVLRLNSAPQVSGNKVIAGFSDGKLAAYSLDKGQLLWEQFIAMPQGATPVEQMVDVVADPVIANGVIYVATYQGKVAAVSLATGDVRWEKDISTYTGLVLTPKLLIVTDAAGTVWAFDRATGNVVWHQMQLANRLLTAPVLMNNTVIVGDGEGCLHVLSLSDGHIVGRVLVDEKHGIVAPPAVLGNQVFVVTRKGELSAFQVSSIQ